MVTPALGHPFAPEHIVPPAGLLLQFGQKAGQVGFHVHCVLPKVGASDDMRGSPRYVIATRRTYTPHSTN